MSNLSEISKDAGNFKSVTSKTILATQFGTRDGFIGNFTATTASIDNLTVSGNTSIPGLVICDGNGNTLVGDVGPVTGVANVYVGCGLASTSTTTGNLNVVVGGGAAPLLTTGARNVVVGGNAGSALLGGNQNVLIGAGAANLNNGSHNVFIVPDTNACEGASGGNGNTVIGNVLCGSDPSNSIMIGSGSVGNVGSNSLAFANLSLTTTASAGGYDPVPANVASYLPVWIGSIEYRIPLFNPA